MIKSVFAPAFMAISLISVVLTGTALAQTPSPEGARVYFIEPAEGSEIEGPVKVTFGLSRIGVAPAGTDKPKTGHHHLLIDTKLEDYTSSIPKDDKHLHFGGGQTETVITLTPGKHTLQLILGDKDHIPHSPPIQSEIITIFVK